MNRETVKRILSLLIAFSMLSAMAVYADTVPTSVWDDTFDGLSAMPSAWTVGAEDGLVPDPVFAGQAVEVTSATNTLESSVTAGGMIVSYDLYISQLPTAAQKVLAVKGTDGDVLTVWANTDALIVYGADATVKENRVSTYPLNEWFTLTAVVDVDAKTTALYVNGVQMSDAVAFESEAVDVTAIQNSFESGMLVDEVYVAAFATGAEAKEVTDARFANSYKYVESLDRGATTKIPPNSSKAFSGELVREEPYTDSYVEYRPYYVCEAIEYQVTSESGSTSYKKAPDILETDTLTGVTMSTQLTIRYDKLAAAQTEYGTENLLLDERSGFLFSKGRAVKSLEETISTGVVVVGMDVYIPTNYGKALTIPLIDLENAGKSVIELNITGVGDGETGVSKLEVVLSDGTVVFAGNYTENRWLNVALILDLNNDTAELLANGVSGGVFATTDFAFDTIKYGATSTLMVDNFLIEAYPNKEYARTAIAVKNVEDEILFSKVSDYLKVKNRFSADVLDLSDAQSEAKRLIPGVLADRDIYGEIDKTWGEDFNAFDDGEEYVASGYDARNKIYVYDGHAKILRNSTDKSRLCKKVGILSGKYTTEFDFMIEEKADTEMIAQITNAAGNGKACYFATRNGDIMLMADRQYTLVDDYREGRWYSFAVEVDIDNKLVDVYIDGVKKTNGYGWNSSSITDARRAFDTYRYEATSYSACEYYIDNLVVHQDVAMPISITSPIFTTADGETSYGAASGGTLESVYVRNEDGISSDLFAGVYVSNRLVEIKRLEGVKDGSQSFALALPETEDDIDVNFFAWDYLTPVIEATPYKKDTTKLFVLSDSIYDGASGQKGIGDELGTFFDPDYVTVENKAMSGNTMQSVAEAGTFNTVLDAIEPGDYVLVSFAHNDSKFNSTGFVMVERDMKAPYAPGTYQDRLIRYANSIRARGGNPIFATSLARYRTDEKIGADHGSYIEAMRKLAKEIDVPLIDLNAYSVSLLENDNETAETRYIMKTLGATNADSTHLTNEGAAFFAEWVVGEIKQLGLPIGEHTKGLE